MIRPIYYIYGMFLLLNYCLTLYFPVLFYITTEYTISYYNGLIIGPMSPRT